MAKGVYNGWEFPSVKAEPPRERFLKLIACPQTTGYDKATVLFAYIPPGGTNGRHAHPDNEEIMYCAGRGECVIGDEKINLETDSVIVVPAGLEHECINTSDAEMLKIFCVYIPALELNELLIEAAEKTKAYLKSK